MTTLIINFCIKDNLFTLIPQKYNMMKEKDFFLDKIMAYIEQAGYYTIYSFNAIINASLSQEILPLENIFLCGEYFINMA